MAESNVHPEPESQKRRSTRISQAVPLTVTGVDALGRPFQERTSSLIINCHGCRYQSKHYVLKNMWVTFEVPHNESGREPRSVRARVTWIQRPRTVRELFQIGVELEVPGNVWGIAFPPSDWFPFPESASNLEIPAPTEIPQAESSGPDWGVNEEPAPQSSEPVETNIRVLPLPGGTDASLQLARQVARLVVEAKQQVEGTVRETATRAVAAETRPLIAALQSQMKDAAEKSVAAAIDAHIERMQREALQRLEAEQAANTAAMRAEWSREMDRRLSEARQQIDSQLSEVERTRRADFEQQIQNQLLVAIEKLQSLSSSLGANAGEVRASIEQMRRSSAEAAADEGRRWQELIDQRTSEAQARLAHLEQAATHLGDKIAGAASAAESGWRGSLDADLAVASARWNEKIETSLAEAAQRTAERIASSAEASSQQVEQRLQHRISVIGSAFSEVTAEAERALNDLRASMGAEINRGQTTMSLLLRSLEQIEVRQGEFSKVIESTSEHMARRSEALLEAQSDEMNRRAELAVTGMADRLQPVLESAGHETIERLANELEQRLAPQITQITEMLGKLSLDREQADKALSEHQHRVWQASERSVQDTVARGKDLLAQVEKEFTESAHNSSAKWLSELEAKATETTHTTFEALFKSAEWYEKKVQTQMQAALEKGVDQAATGLREKAGELSGLFASELDHYSRSYVEHAQGQMDEHARDAAEKAALQMAQAADASAATFSGRAEELLNGQYDAFSAKTKSAFDENVARTDAHTLQVRSKLEGDAKILAGEFQSTLSDQVQRSLADGKLEMASQVNLAKDSLRAEAESLGHELRNTLQSLGARAMDEYKQRLENASNSWLLTTVTRLDQQSEGLIEQLASSTEVRLRSVCSSVFAEVGETLRQRMAGLSAPVTAPAPAPIHPEFPPKDEK